MDVSRYGSRNRALSALVNGGTKLTPLRHKGMEAAFSAANKLYAELSAKSPELKKIYDNWQTFRNEAILWFRVCEGSATFHGLHVGGQKAPGLGHNLAKTPLRRGFFVLFCGSCFSNPIPHVSLSSV